MKGSGSPVVPTVHVTTGEREKGGGGIVSFHTELETPCDLTCEQTGEF